MRLLLSRKQRCMGLVQLFLCIYKGRPNVKLVTSVRPLCCIGVSHVSYCAEVKG